MVLHLLLAVEACLRAPLAAESPVPAASPEPAPSVSAAASPVPSASPAPAKARRKKSAKKATAPAEPRKTARALPPLLREVEEHYARTDTLSADFEQVNHSAATGTQTRSSGQIMVKKPDKMRWDTTAPDRNLLVSDGKRFWFYTPPFEAGERGQVVERKTSEVQSRLANALLSGRFAIVKDMRVEARPDSWFALTPRPGTAGTVLKAEVRVDPARKLIEKVVLEHRGGNRGEITLKNIDLEKKLGDELFQFVVPPDTDRMQP